MASSNRETQVEAIRGFWSWFASNAQKLRTLHANRDFATLAREVNRELDKIEPQLAWEIGPGKNQPNLLTISAEGNAELRPLAETMIELAPNLTGWEFHSARPARPAPVMVRLPASGVAFDTSDWEFIPVEQPASGRLDLVVVDDQLARSDREPALRAVSIYLDEVLGEEAVETWIGQFELQSRIAAYGRKTYKIAELPDYLLWARHRGSNPLRKPDRKV